MIFDHPWLGHLFGDAEVARLWSAEVQLEHYRAFEKALAQALETSKLVPLGFGEQAATSIDVAHIDIASLASATLRDGLP
ncbi:MAG: 3-carboxy-cis,cis-muconate cycloisomerase, partial [Pseudomonadota bacterium]